MDTGYPDNSPKTSPYFSHPLHQSDQYSISFCIDFKTTSQNGDDVVFGNDFDHPIRDSLPPGFQSALRIVQWTIDPTMDGDAYADKPYLYSPALATWNQFRIGEMMLQGKLPSVHDKVVEEGADGAGAVEMRTGIPEDARGRRKYFQYEENRKEFVWQAGRLYWADFGNPYLGFQGWFLQSIIPYMLRI